MINGLLSWAYSKQTGNKKDFVLIYIWEQNFIFQLLYLEKQLWTLKSELCSLKPLLWMYSEQKAKQTM